MMASILRTVEMSRKIQQLLVHQSQIKVAEQSLPTVSGDVLLVALATFFAGVFYFFSYYYFWGSLGRALTGN
jgi:hypothetical protein